MNRVFRSGRGEPRTISDKTVTGALLPCTAVFVGATALTQATAISGGRLALLGDRDYYNPGGITLSTDPLFTPYVSGETGIAYLLKPDDEVAWAMAAATYNPGQELMLGAAGRLTAATSGNVVVAHWDAPTRAVSAGDLGDVVVANFYTKA